MATMPPAHNIFRNLLRVLRKNMRHNGNDKAMANAKSFEFDYIPPKTPSNRTV